MARPRDKHYTREVRREFALIPLDLAEMARPGQVTVCFDWPVVDPMGSALMVRLPTDLYFGARQQLADLVRNQLRAPLIVLLDNDGAAA